MGLFRRTPWWQRSEADAETDVRLLLQNGPRSVWWVAERLYPARWMAPSTRQSLTCKVLARMERKGEVWTGTTLGQRVCGLVSHEGEP